MKKIALMTIFQVPNYGSVLQTYASQKVLEKLGYECEIINYRYPNQWHFNHGWPTPTFTSTIREKIGRLLNIRNGKINNALSDFKSKYLNLTNQFADFQALSDFNWDDYILISGSDQIWNPHHLKGDKSFLLAFAPQHANKLSFASSFACDELPEEYVKSYQKHLSQYKAISIREKNGIGIIKSQLHLSQAPHIMLDPTLLLSFDDWMTLTHNTPGVNEPYILVYELTYSLKCSNEISALTKQLQAEIGCDSIICLGDGKSIPYGKNYQGCSIGEFIQLFANASAVVTNSFHGTAFAVNAGKPLISVTPDTGDDRQSTLLNALGLSACTFRVNIPAEKYKDYHIHQTMQAQEDLKALRFNDLKWLKENLECCK